MSRNMLCIVDVETGGLDCKKHALVEISAVGLDKDDNLMIPVSCVIKPYDNKLEYTDKAMQVHGITKREIDAGEDLEDVITQLEFLFTSLKTGRKKPILVGHNIAFDLEFIIDAFSRCGKNLYDYVDRVNIDTMLLSKLMYGMDKEVRHDLASVCERVGVGIYDAHRSKSDIIGTGKLLKAMIEIMSNGKISEIIGKDDHRKGFRL